MHQRPFRQVGLVLAGALLALVSLVVSPGANPFTAVEFWMRDSVLKRLSTAPADGSIALVDIDETSLQSVGPWPWDRSRLAALASALIDQHGARIVALDMVLPEPKDAAGDAALLKLAQDRKLVLAQVFDFAARETPFATGIPSGGFQEPQPSPHPEAVQATGYIANHAGLNNAPCVGNIGFIPDPDGKLRSVIHQSQHTGILYPSLALATALCQPKEKALPQVATQQRLLFDIQPEQWHVIPAGIILDAGRSQNTKEEITALLHGRAVIVGSSALGLSDRVATAISPNISGMFVHAQALSEILHPRGHDTSRWGTALTILVQIALTIICGLVVIRSTKFVWMFVWMVGLLAIWLWISIQQIQAGNSVNLSAPLWGFLFYGFILVPHEWFGARAQNRNISRVLARYVSKPVLQELLAQSDINPLKPRSAEITVLIADMVSYTQTVAQQSLDDAAQLTKNFLEKITEPVWMCRGTLDRYTGDGLIAFWGAPIPDPDHAALAVDAARRMREKITELNRENAARGLPQLAIRIGIASGQALVGDFGSPQRANYTAVGKCINMASRLESAARELQVDTVISETTANALQATDLRPLGSHDIRGIGSTNLYTLK